MKKSGWGDQSQSVEVKGHVFTVEWFDVMCIKGYHFYLIINWIAIRTLTLTFKTQKRRSNFKLFCTVVQSAPVRYSWRILLIHSGRELLIHVGLSLALPILYGI